MKREKLIKILNEEYPHHMAMEGDFNGLQVIGSEEVSKILVVLDLTMDTVSQAINAGANMIITHHPLFFGEAEELMDSNPMLRAKVQMLSQHEINVFSLHTPADFAPNSIAFNQAAALELDEIIQLENNIAVIGQYKEDVTLEQIVNEARTTLELPYSFRTNAELSNYYKDIIIGSGMSGDLVFNNNAIGKLLIVGEAKHHHWVEANKLGIDMLEIGHYSEHIFKDMIEALLSEEVEVIKGREENGYKHV